MEHPDDATVTVVGASTGRGAVWRLGAMCCGGGGLCGLGGGAAGVVREAEMQPSASAQQQRITAAQPASPQMPAPATTTATTTTTSKADNHKSTSSAVSVPDLPPGWKPVPSRSRPDRMAFMNEFTGERISWVPTEPASQVRGEVKRMRKAMKRVASVPDPKPAVDDEDEPAPTDENAPATQASTPPARVSQV